MKGRVEDGRAKSLSLDGAGVFTRRCRNNNVEMEVWQKEGAAPASGLWGVWLSKFSMRKPCRKLYL